jgi:hypothetical protein
MKKGIIFTIDTLIAISLVLIFMGVILSNLNYTKPIDYQQSYFARDYMKVLHQTNSLKNETEIINYIDALPIQICGKITTFNQSLDIEFNHTKNNCEEKDVVYVSWKLFWDNEIYLAKGEFWLK